MTLRKTDSFHGSFPHDEYIRRSIFEPNADVVVDFMPVMPSQKGLLSEDDVKAIIEYMKTLK